MENKIVNDNTDKQKLYKVLRGSHQIGGSVVEITSIKGTRIWVDFGMELSVEEDYSTDERLIELMKDSKTRPHAVFFTHIHGDHIGLLPYVEDGVHIFIGKSSKNMLDNIYKTLIKVEKNPNKKKNIKRSLELLDTQKNSKFIHFYEINEEQDNSHFEDIAFKPLCVDHSVFDSYMIRFEVDGKVIVHTGDFRDHGRLGSDLIKNVKDHFNPEDKGIDILITEGTMMSRDGEEILTEEELQKLAEDNLDHNKYAFLICSSTNLESLASFYQAAMKKEKDFYCNSYVMKQLKLYTEKLGSQYKEFNFVHAKPIWKAPKFDACNEPEKGFVMLVNKSDYYQELIRNYKSTWGEEKFVLFYSLWSGYLQTRKIYGDRKLINLVGEWHKEKVKKLHTSGHASKETIIKVIEALHPNEAIIPIHTERPEAFYDLKVEGYIDNSIKELVKKGNDAIEDEYCELIYKDEVVIKYSRAIRCMWDNEQNPSKLSMRITNPLVNMQTDAAAFEGIISVLWSARPEIEVEISFDNRNIWNGKFPLQVKKNTKRVEKELLSYMRFLYRVMKFEECYGSYKGKVRFLVAASNKNELDTFKSCYNANKGNYYITKPGKKSGVSRKNKIRENHLEKWFVMNSRSKTNNWIQNSFGKQINLYDQMPCRLFVDNVCEKNKIFNGGFIDLWGCDDENILYIFELKKKGNNKLGIISELFFYAMIADDMRQAKIDINQKQESYRGLNTFMNSNKQAPIHAVFLTHSLHSGIDVNKLLPVLQKEGIVEFHSINFNQDKIIGDNTDSFLEKLRTAWDKYNYEDDLIDLICNVP